MDWIVLSLSLPFPALTKLLNVFLSLRIQDPGLATEYEVDPERKVANVCQKIKLFQQLGHKKEHF